MSISIQNWFGGRGPALGLSMLCVVGFGSGCDAGMAAADHHEVAQDLKAAARPEGDRSSVTPVSFGATAVVIELTDNDIEFQAFVDGSYTSVTLKDPRGREIYEAETDSKLRSQHGLTDHFFASVPTHYLEDEPEFDGTIAEFLGRFPEGTYRFLGADIDHARVTGEATLSHVLAALPKIVAPIARSGRPPVVARNNVVIDWEPVTTRFDGPGSIDIIEYQVVVEHTTLRRPTSLIDGFNRRMVVNLPSSVTELLVPGSFMLPNTDYTIEIIATAANGNTSISVAEFITGN